MEGPSLVILSEELQKFKGKTVLKVSGNTKQPKDLLKGLILQEIDTWGKVLFLIFSDPHTKKDRIVTKTHFLMFGSYRIDEPKDQVPRLELKFSNGLVDLYSCSIQFFSDEYLNQLDRDVDIMSPDWNEEHVLKLMTKRKNDFLCDLFLDQRLFAGSGNIVKNEALFNLRIHPMTKLSQINKKDWPLLIHAVKEYCFNFYEWKKKFELKQHWQVYRQNICPVCSGKIKRENMGKFHRREFYCPHCQRLNSGHHKLNLFPVLPIKDPSGEKEAFDH